MNKNIELLAPAGNYESFIAAIENGADAVYMGGKLFNARANANNFTDEELEKIVEYAHLRNSKVYITLNTLLDNDELNDALNFSYKLYEIGVDGVIVQDFGLAYILHKYIPNLPLHASTQMTIYNLEGIKELEKIGFKRAVLARELSFEEIRNICENTSMEIEVFIHGALCVSYSGQCLLSSMIGDRSGNRGKCAQPCRMQYELLENDKSIKNGYLLSPKDLCTIDLLKEYPNVHSLKIEGRMKSPEYVATVVHIYRKYIDNIKNGLSHEVSSDDKKDLIQIFSRGDFTDAYLHKKQGSSMMCYEKQDAYNTSTKELNRKAHESYLRNFVKKSPINMDIYIKLNEPISVKINDYIYTSNIYPSIAIKQPLLKEKITEQFSKTGDTPFCIKNMSINMDENIFIPVSSINEIRRNSILSYQSILIKNFKKTIEHQKLEKVNTSKNSNEETKKVSLLVNKLNLDYINLKNVDNFYIPIKEALLKLDVIKRINTKKYIVFPTITKSNYDKLIRKNISKLSKYVDGFVISNIGQLEYVRCFNKEIIANYTFNIFNDYTIEFLKNIGIGKVILSPELTATQIRNISSNIDTELITYGKQCVMTSEYCVIGAAKGNFSSNNKCSKPCLLKNKYYLKDRLGMKFSVIPDNIDCQSTIYNSKITSINSKNININSIRIDISDEPICEIQKIIDTHKNGNKLSGIDYTNGHITRPV